MSGGTYFDAPSSTAPVNDEFEALKELYGVVAMNYDPSSAGLNNSAGVTTTRYLAGLWVPRPATLTGLVIGTSAVGSGYTANQCFVGAYTYADAGTQLAVSAAGAFETALATGPGWISTAFAAPVDVDAGWYYGCALIAASSMPGYLRQGANGVVNKQQNSTGGLVPLRFASAGTGASLPATLPALSQSSAAMFFAFTGTYR